MGKYGEAAIRAVDLYSKGIGSPMTAWEAATCELFGKGTSSQQKGGPRIAFLGLCEEGKVKGIPPGSYTGHAIKNKKNKEYALRGPEILETVPNSTPSWLWREVAGDKAHNGQIDVVVVLWERRLILR